MTPCRLVRVDPPCRGRGAGYRSVAAGSISHLSKSSTLPPLSSFRAGVFPRFLPPIFHEGPVRLGSISVGAGVGKRRRGRSTSGCIRGVVRVSVRLSSCARSRSLVFRSVAQTVGSPGLVVPFACLSVALCLRLKASLLFGGWRFRPSFLLVRTTSRRNVWTLLACCTGEDRGTLYPSTSWSRDVAQQKCASEPC